MTPDRLMFLLLWCKRSGLSEGNVRIQWDQLSPAERAELAAWAKVEG